MYTSKRVPVTRDNCETAQNFEHTALKNADGSPLRARRNGKTKIWKTRPGDFRIPCKYGIKVCFYITPSNASEWTCKPSLQDYWKS